MTERGTPEYKATDSTPDNAPINGRQSSSAVRANVAPPVYGNPILVVDDEESNRDLLSRRLKKAGFEVALAEDGQSALEQIQKHHIDLVLLDIMMPGMTGLELLKLLRGVYSPVDLPVIMVSAVSESEKVVEALNLGANDYVTKPVDFSVALARIRSQLNQKRAEAALRESQERYALAARGSNDGLWDWDLRSDKIYLSPRWREILGYSEEELGDDPEEWLGRVHSEDVESLRAELSQLAQSKVESGFTREHRVQHKDGRYRWIFCRGGVMPDTTGLPIRIAGSISDITSSKSFDALTGLANRLQCTETLQRVVDRSGWKPEHRIAVMFIDLDRFKLVNDSLGHLVGDQLLVAVGKRLTSAVRQEREDRPSDVVARFGGDEFTIVLEDVSSLADVKGVAHRIQTELSLPFSLDGRQLFTSASIGIAISTPETRSATELLRDADLAMYRAKSLGKARCEVFDSQMRADAVERLELESDLRQALQRNELLLHYQPKVELISERIVGFEALLRWRHPKHGTIQPMRFIPLAEETGLILPIGRWVLEQACRQIKEWQAQFASDPPLEISVNVSVKQLKYEAFIDTVREVIESVGVPAKSVQLEITESVLIDDSTEVPEALRKLKELGVGLKIDDFGTGYSSLSYLSLYPFDAVKIDKSFVIHLNEEARNIEVVNTILALTRSLRMHSIAEGVETRGQLSQLRDLGCEFGQGFYFARPVSATAAEKVLSKQFGG